MLYHLFTTLREIYDLPGAGLFSFVSFRAGMSLDDVVCWWAFCLASASSSASS